MTLNDYAGLFANLPVNRKGNSVAPHKAILLLSVLELIEEEEIDTPFIPISKSLKKTFKKIWRKYVPESSKFNCALNYPFFHLSYSPFWKLVKLPSFESKNEYSSLMALKKSFAGAMIDTDLFLIIKNEPENSNLLKKILISTYLET